MNDVEQFIIDYLRSRTLSRSASDALDGTSRLHESGLLDSLELMSLVTHLEQSYGFSLPDDEFVPENFETPRTIADMIKRVTLRPK
jgi:acyl carrier protein